MLKLVISTIFFGSTVLGFSTQNSSFSEETSPYELFSFIGKMSPEDLASVFERVRFSENFCVYTHMGLGALNIDAGDYSSAIENFDKAESINKESAKLQPELDFWISFCRAIAYDNLGMSKECAQSIGSLVLIAYNMNGEDADKEDEGIADEESDEATQFLQKLASRAKSWNVRKYLLEITNGLDEEDSD